MALPEIFKGTLRLPVVGAPLFIISHPPLVLAQCKAGIVGSFPALNARPEAQLDEWLAQITEELANHNAANPDRPAAPFAVNQIVHRSSSRHDGLLHRASHRTGHADHASGSLDWSIKMPAQAGQIPAGC